MTSQMKIGILGGGAMANAISHLLSFNKIEHEIYSRTKQNIEQISNCEIVFICISSEAISAYITLFSKAKIVISCAKGIYTKAQPFISQSFFARQFCVLSGPNFASEILESQNTLTTIASQNSENFLQIQKFLTTPFFQIETTQNVLGVEICGILKNAIAIIMGFYGAKTNSWNEKSFILTKVFQEAVQILNHFEIDAQILNQSCGIGDLFLTCSTPSSRNYKFGFQAYSGNANTKETVEGIRSFEFLDSLDLNLQFLKKPF
jgi:glycerol-3-phosphate dehydrogenase (NAD(P)+)